MNREFLKMQKLAGLITENQFRQLNENQTRYFIVVNFKGLSDELGNFHGIEASDKDDFIQKFKGIFNDNISDDYTFYEIDNKNEMDKILKTSDEWEGGEDTPETEYLQNIADKAKSFGEIYF